MVQEYTIDNPDELEELMQVRKFRGTHTRLNVARNNETWVHPKGRTLLVTPVLSEVVKRGRSLTPSKISPLGGTADPQQKPGLH